MTNGVKVNLVYHFYCKSVEDIRVGCGNVYNEINRRCLEHFHDVFDTATFCVCVDNQGDSELIQKAVEWIWSCGFKENVVIKVKPNTPYRDAKTFYDEVVNHLSDFDGMVFFGHNKGNTKADMNGMRQWIAFSYYSCLDEINEKVRCLTDDCVSFCYQPIESTACKPYNWYSPGNYWLLNPMKLDKLKSLFGTNLPKLTDRISAEFFIPSIIDIKNPPYGYHIRFDSLLDSWWIGDFSYYDGDHMKYLSYFLSMDRLQEYSSFFERIVDGL